MQSCRQLWLSFQTMRLPSKQNKTCARERAKGSGWDRLANDRHQASQHRHLSNARAMLRRGRATPISRLGLTVAGKEQQAHRLSHTHIGEHVGGCNVQEHRPAVKLCGAWRDPSCFLPRSSSLHMSTPGSLSCQTAVSMPSAFAFHRRCMVETDSLGSGTYVSLPGCVAAVLC